MENLLNKECASSSTATFHAFLDQNLILKDGSDYKLCKFSPANSVTSPIPMVTLTLPSSTIGVSGAITRFMPYYNTDTNIYVAVTDGTDTAFVFYATNTASSSNPLKLGKLFIIL